MRTFSNVIARWGTATELAADIGGNEGTVRQWKRRNSIPAAYWPAVIAAAVKRGMTDITAERLAAIAQRRRAA